jgi:hypothetical protein
VPVGLNPAAVNGDRDTVRQALLLDPFPQNRDSVTLVPKLVDGFYRIHRQFLPG